MSSDFHIRQAARVVHAGGVIAYPTEGVFGLGCDPRDPAAVTALLAIKGRPATRGLILIGASLEQLDAYCAPLTRSMRGRLNDDWPGPVTWLVPAAATTPWWLTGGGPTVAVRVPAHAGARALCARIGAPIVSTSANLTGRAPARNTLSVRRMLGAAVDYILPGELGDQRGPSEIRDATSGRILRPGK